MSRKTKNRRSEYDRRNRRRFNQNRHHNVAKSRGGSWKRKNIIWLDVDFHNELHRLFGNKSLKEIIAVLERLDKAKEKQQDGELLAEKYRERFSHTEKVKANWVFLANKLGDQGEIEYWCCYDCDKSCSSETLVGRHTGYCFHPTYRVEFYKNLSS